MREVSDAELLEALASYARWETADAIQRSFRLGLYDPDAPSLALVARRLSRLAREGRCEKRHENGAGLYRLRA